MVVLTDCLATLAAVEQAVDTPGPPFLFTDLYPLDLDDPRTPQLDDPDWSFALSDIRLRGAILKAWDGVSYGEKYSDWFVRNFKKLVDLYRDERGRTRFAGGYLYAQFSRDPVRQADAYVAALESAGWTAGVDVVPVVDVEGGGERSANRRATRQQVVDCVSKIVERVRERTGTGVMLYGRGLMRDLSIGSRMGCDRVWNPSYTERMVTNGLTGVLPNGNDAPWALEDIKLWQYGGDGVGDADVHHLPLSLVGLGKVDVSVFVAGDKRPTIQMVREALL